MEAIPLTERSLAAPKSVLASDPTCAQPTMNNADVDAEAAKADDAAQ